MNFIWLTVIGYCVLSAFSVKPKLCVNCKFFRRDFFGDEFGKCALFTNEVYNDSFLVTGIREPKTIDYNYCSIARKYDHMCGKEGRQYVKK